jgi:hypothetical protein
MECSSSTSPPVPALAAEVLFLRKQLAYYRDQQIRPRRLTDPARLSLVSGPGFSTGVKERLHQLENYARTAWVETVENAGRRLEGLPSVSHLCSVYARRIAQEIALQLRCKSECSVEATVGLPHELPFTRSVESVCAFVIAVSAITFHKRLSLRIPERN